MRKAKGILITIIIILTIIVAGVILGSSDQQISVIDRESKISADALKVSPEQDDFPPRAQTSILHVENRT